MSDILRDRVVAALGQQYELDAEIGRGGMSVVYRARDIRLNRPVAVKVLPPELAYDPAIRLRFTREAQTSAQLSHSNIVPIYDVGERDGIAYFVMAIITGGNLGEVLAREPRLPIDEVRRILCEISDALAHAHQHGVIHRDIKPDNILLDRHSGRAMVTDFGIARAVEAGTRLTITGIAVGTPTYMSPEQATGDKEVDGRSDIYSLGVVAYQMLTGRVPFTGGNSMALLLKHVSERPRPIADLRPDAPRSLREAVERALSKEPEERWPTASALRDAISSNQLQPWAAPVPAPSSAAQRQDPPPAEVRRRERAARESQRAEVRYISPRRGVQGVGNRPTLPALLEASGQLQIEPEQFANLTKEQRDDLLLWDGRINLVDRVKRIRWYALYTGAATIGAMIAIAAAVDADFPPLAIAPLMPVYMSIKLWKRAQWLRQAGLKLRRVFGMPRARQALPALPPALRSQQLEKLASKEILAGPWGSAIRRAVADRTAIFEIISKLSKTDRSFLPDVEPTVKALVERVVNMAGMLHSLDASIDSRLMDDLDNRIADCERGGDSTEVQRHLTLLRRQRGTFEELLERRAELSRQLDNAGLALGNLRLDLVKLRSSGIQSALSDVTSATQAARALSSEIGAVVDAVVEVRGR
jgi:serine/threonine protein kinase